jgi:hypothetical protein
MTSPITSSSVPPGGEWLDRLRDYGWRQGSLIPSELRDGVTLREGAQGLEELDVLMVISHDCDVVHGSLEAEPVVEIIGARARAATDPAYVHLRHPRILHVESLGVVVQPALEFHARDRGVLPRVKLADARPIDVLPWPALAELTDWLGRRYVRPAFPDSFLARLTSGRRRLERLMSRHASAIVGLYLALDSWDEHPDDRPYRVILRVVVDEDTWLSDTRVPAEIERSFYDPLLRIFREAPGIEVTDHLLLPEHQLRLSDLKKLEQLDFEFLSYEEGIPPRRGGAQPPLAS